MSGSLAFPLDSLSFSPLDPDPAVKVHWAIQGWVFALTILSDRLEILTTGPTTEVVHSYPLSNFRKL